MMKREERGRDMTENTEMTTVDETGGCNKGRPRAGSPPQPGAQGRPSCRPGRYFRGEPETFVLFEGKSYFSGSGGFDSEQSTESDFKNARRSARCCVVMVRFCRFFLSRY